MKILQGDSREVLRTLPDSSIDSCVTDPPYALISIVKRFGATNAAPAISNGATGVYARASSGFMGKTWDTGETAFSVEFWAEVLRVLKPGGHVIAFGGTRTYHRLACAIEDAGFEIRDLLSWLYGTGFPKSHDVGKGLDKAAGVEREILRERYTVKRINPGATVVANGEWGKQEIPYTATDSKPTTPEAVEWDGWGTALKPALEPIAFARKPLSGKTVAANVLRWRTGAINIDGCRVPGAFESGWSKSGSKASENIAMSGANYAREPKPDNAAGRWPANVMHDGSDEVVGMFPNSNGQQGRALESGDKKGNIYGNFGSSKTTNPEPRNDSGSAARFFYSAKASKTERNGSKHPTVKPVALMQWLCRLVTPPGGVVLDPFAGSGTTGEAANREGFDCILIERETEYVTDIKRRFGARMPWEATPAPFPWNAP